MNEGREVSSMKRLLEGADGPSETEARGVWAVGGAQDILFRIQQPQAQVGPTSPGPTAPPAPVQPWRQGAGRLSRTGPLIGQGQDVVQCL